MFRSATFRLTMYYLLIVMAISLFFSAALYRVATNELSHGLARESQRIYRNYPVFADDPILQTRPDFAQSSHRILWQLAGFNLLVLFGAGYASYYLARRTLKPIEASHDRQQRFTADVSHELRTPLTAMRMEGEVALLNPKLPAKELRITIKSNLEEITKLETLINNLLRLSKLENEQLQQNFTTIEVAPLVQAAVDQVQALATAKSITIDSTVTGGSIRGDMAALTQLLVILLDNAIKYSRPRSSVTLSAEKQGEHIRFSVTDTGKGITPQALQHIFERFYREDSSRGKVDSEGYGLGLSIGEMIADSHGSQVTIASSPGKGTTASFSLPITSQT